ncbi:MAG: PmoA family protein [Verrucomicrobiae bacterium]|nr:PmoA family protein [Verrucomicrobiae bacterium]
MKTFPNCLPILAAIGALSLSAIAAEFTVEKEADGVVIKIDGKLFTKYVTGDKVGNKPYFYPVIGPTGKGMTRAYPMEDVKGEAQDHPHHRSFYFGHQFVNDNDTWHEELTLKERAKGDEAKLAELKKTLGATKNREILQAESKGDHAILKVTSDYFDAKGERMAEDVRTFTFRVAADGSRVVDADITFTAVMDTVKFADAKDAGFSLRVAHSMSVDAKEGGRIVNSHGDLDKDAWGKRAEWCDFNGPVGGEKLGIAMLNHPASFRFPTPWHARTYGLFTANPFGLKSVAGEKEDGSVILKKGESFTIRHRVIFHAGDEKDAKIAEAFEAYAKEK